MPSKTEQPLQRALKEFDEARKWHDGFSEKVEQRYRAYDGVLERASEAKQFDFKVHPPFINHIVETGLAGYINDPFRFRILPRPKLFDPQEFERLTTGAKAFELLIARQLERARMDENERPFALQNDIAGLTVAKQQWRTDKRTIKRQATRHRPVFDLFGKMFDRLPERYVEEVEETTFDGPISEVVDVRDFFWHEAAVSLDRSPYVFHRIWMTKDELLALEAAGVYGPEAGGEKIDDLAETRSSLGTQAATREQGLFDADRTKDMVEVVEAWRQTPTGIHTLTFANRSKLLSKWRPNPFWHGEYPFVVCSTQSHLFRIPGKSRVEKLEQLQELLWMFMSQRITNTVMVNNAIAIINEDLVDDVDSLTFEPHAQWLVRGDANQAVQMWSPDPISAQIALPAENDLKSTMQNISQSQPFTSTSEARGLGADTATEAALVTNLAQRSAQMQKRQFHLAYKRIGEQVLRMNQQFIRTPQVEQVFGTDNDPRFERILPDMLDGDFDFSVQPMTESMNRAERRSENQSLLQIASSTAAVFAATGNPLNLKAFMEDVLDAYDRPDKDKYFSAIPQQVPGQSGVPGTEPEGPGGVTAPQATDPATSPSNQASLSPEVFAQRAGAMGGGVSNA